MIKTLTTIVVFLLCVPLLSADEWSTAIKTKSFGANTKALPTVIAAGKLDAGAFKSKLNGKPVLTVRLRNGKHKMGSSTIQLRPPESPVVLQFQRVDIAKPMSIITKKPDGAHLFDTFACGGKTYKIFYHIKDGKLASNVTFSSGADKDE